MSENPSLRSSLERIAPALVLAVTFLAYAAVFLFQFVYDDEYQVVHNLFVQQWHFAPSYFTSHVSKWLAPQFGGTYYRPLFLLWELLNFKLFGLWPAGWHATALTLHLVVTWQVYRLALRLFANDAAALMAALLFGLHPVHIEAVAWVAGATETLVAVCILGSLLSYIAFRTTAKNWQYWATLAWFAAGMLMKETAIVTPLLLFAYDVIVRSEPTNLVERVTASVKRLWPTAAIFVVYLAARYNALHGLWHSVTPISLPENLLTIPSVLLFYARLLIYPLGLSVFYETPYVTSLSAALGPALACLGAASIAVLLLRRWGSRATAFSIVLLAVPIVMALKLSVFPRGEIAHDRYLYVPSVGFALLAAALVQAVRPSGRRLAIIGCLLLACAYFAATMTQSLYWANNLVLYARGIQIAPRHLTARVDFANELLKRGDTAQAEEQYRRILGIDPNFWLAHYNLGYAEYKKGDCAAAVRELEIAASQRPDDAEAVFYFGECLARIGDRRPGAVLMRRGIALEPRLPNFRAKLADVLSQGGDPAELQEALQLYRTEAQANPAHPYAAARAGELAAKLGASHPAP